MTDHCGWDVEYGQVCTATPGVLHPSGNLITLCPPERECTDCRCPPDRAHWMAHRRRDNRQRLVPAPHRCGGTTGAVRGGVVTFLARLVALLDTAVDTVINAAVDVLIEHWVKEGK